MDYLFGPTKAEFYSLIKAERVMRGPLNPIPISRRIELWGRGRRAVTTKMTTETHWRYYWPPLKFRE